MNIWPALRLKVKSGNIALYGEPIWELRSVTCRMGSHSEVTMWSLDYSGPNARCFVCYVFQWYQTNCRSTSRVPQPHHRRSLPMLLILLTRKLTTVTPTATATTLGCHHTLLLMLLLLLLFILGVHGLLKSSKLIRLKSSSLVLVVMGSISTPICNRFHCGLANNVKITTFTGVLLFDALMRRFPWT